MNLFKDIKGFLTVTEVEVKKIQHLHADYYNFQLKPLSPLGWASGQHVVVTVTHEKIKGASRPFSVASSSDEGSLFITTKISKDPSPFKAALKALKPGMRLKVRGPMGSFDFEDTDPICFIASGLGITPFRSLLSNWVKQNPSFTGTITLLYVNHNEQFLYSDFINDHLSKMPLKVDYLVGRQAFSESLKSYVSEKPEAKFLMAGSGDFVKQTRLTLKELGIKKKSIHGDTFHGL